jgi:peptidoglycan hydrolase CwlO-like protein
VPKKTATIIFIVTSILFTFALLGRAQKDTESGSDVADLVNQFSAEVAKLDAKIDKVSASQDSADKEILQKLDQVLGNQEKMIKELEIVKLRASRQH